MMKRRNALLSMTIASALGLFVHPLTSYAFGLGKLELKSALNQPFKAEIKVTSLQADEQDNFSIQLASAAEFTQAGLERTPLLAQLRFDIIETNGQTKVLISSERAVREPFVNFLLTARAGGSRLLREYTALLDPPDYSRPSQPILASQDANNRPVATQAASSVTTTDYAVKATDTLWDVALATRPNDQVSVHQMMMALLAVNPQAFTNNNVNGLKAGVTLDLPDNAQIQRLSRAEAQSAFAEQNRLWQQRNQPTQPVTTANTTQSDVDSGTNTENTTAEQRNETLTEADNVESLSSSNTEQSRLKLVNAAEANDDEQQVSQAIADDDQLQRLTTQLSIAQETMEAQAQENQDFKTRMDAMEAQLDTMRRLISLKDADLAKLQDLLQEEDSQLAADVKDILSPEAVSENLISEPVDELINETESTAAALGDMPALADDSIATDADLTAVESPSNSSELPPPEQQIQSLIAQIQQFIKDYKFVISAGLLVLFLLFMLWLRRRQNEALTEENSDLFAPVTIPADRTNLTAHADLTDAPLEDFDDPKSVDELLEHADMFIGYADYTQARQALDQAFDLEPNNRHASYKYLFVLYKQKQAQAFLSKVEQSGIGPEDHEWYEVRQWGHELMPVHPLFIVETFDQIIDTMQTPSATATAQRSNNETMQLNESSELDSSVEEDASEDQPLEYVQVDLNELRSEPELTSSPEYDDVIEFEADDTDASSPQRRTEFSTDNSTQSDLDDELLNFDASQYATDDQEEIEVLDLSEFNNDEELTALSFDLEENDNRISEHHEQDDLSVPELDFELTELDGNDVEAKLELAASYLDMGDREEADNILNEVLLTGTTAQQARAKKLLNQ